jgi:hypothetical protein
MRPDEPNKPNKKLERNNVFAANKKILRMEITLLAW